MFTENKESKKLNQQKQKNWAKNENNLHKFKPNFKQTWWLSVAA